MHTSSSHRTIAKLEALVLKFGGRFLSEQHRLDAIKHVREELNAAVLLDVLVTNRDDRFSVDDFGQVDSDQGPYGEVFLSEEGASVVSEGLDVPASSTLRVAFYLHFFDSLKPLRTSYGDVPVPALGAMSKRLAALVPYEPVT